ncbi:MAG: rhodanese-like domain-containing protein [Elusimicrobia bacterium]|nr:rhodanese-like domain-containing protein [Elusimicrobiota bacterium]
MQVKIKVKIENYILNLSLNLNLPFLFALYLIYCRSGKRSANTLSLMKELGFAEAHHIEGGILAWIQAGLPVVAMSSI